MKTTQYVPGGGIVTVTGVPDHHHDCLPIESYVERVDWEAAS